MEVRRRGALVLSPAGVLVELPLAEAAGSSDLVGGVRGKTAASEPEARSHTVSEPRILPEHPSRPLPDEAGLAAKPPQRFSRQDVRLRLATELPRILSDSRVQPRIRGGEIIGLELVSFPMDTVLGQTGLLPGDVLLAVNGREVRGMESLGVLLQRFQSASEVDITIDRSGLVVSLRYLIE